MPFWRISPLEQEFLEDDSTRHVLLTIDCSFWAICTVNTCAQFFWFPRIVVDSTMRTCTGAAIVLYMLIAALVMVAVIKYPMGYYRHRDKVMIFNRSIRILIYALACWYADTYVDDVLAEREKKFYVTDKLAAGRHPLLIIFLILTQVPGNHLLWSLYFPLPIYQGLWLDLVQAGVKLISVKRIVRLLELIDMRGPVASVCRSMNLPFNVYSMAMMYVAPFGKRCGKDGALLLSLFTWGFFGSFWPTFTAWYCESVLRDRFLRRRHHGVGQHRVLWGSIQQYLGTNIVVASFFWLVLQVLLIPERNREMVMRALLFDSP